MLFRPSLSVEAALALAAMSIHPAVSWRDGWAVRELAHHGLASLHGAAGRISDAGRAVVADWPDDMREALVGEAWCRLIRDGAR